MNICYYNSQIKEELDGAKAYIEKAISCKKMSPSRAKIFADMSSMELGHAKNLMSFFEEDYDKEISSMETVPDIYPQIRDDLLKMYTEYSANAKSMYEIYSSK